MKWKYHYLLYSLIHCVTFQFAPFGKNELAKVGQAW